MTETHDDVMTQEAPFPHELQRLVSSLTYKPRWSTALIAEFDRGQGSRGLTLQVSVQAPNSLDPSQSIGVRHLFVVPAASYNRDSWMRWLLDRLLDVETHEACEFFRIDSERVYAPHHSEGEDPYIIWQTDSSGRGEMRNTDQSTRPPGPDRVAVTGTHHDEGRTRQQMGFVAPSMEPSYSRHGER